MMRLVMCAVAVLALAYAAYGDIEAEQKQAALYCEMIQIHADTNGEFGWPPFKGAEQCSH